MGRNRKTEDTVQYNVRVTKSMNDAVQEKMDILGYLSMTELLRELMRNWLYEGES